MILTVAAILLAGYSNVYAVGTNLTAETESIDSNINCISTYTSGISAGNNQTEMMDILLETKPLFKGKVKWRKIRKKLRKQRVNLKKKFRKKRKKIQEIHVQ